MQRVLSYLRRAVEDYDLISDGDRIAVGVSGGKDSLLLLCALNAFKRFCGIDFSLVGITLDMGFDEKTDFAPLAEFFANEGIEYRVRETQIGQIVFNIRQEDSPCSLCARMRRGALHDAAKELGCNKVALGHNRDDLLETFVMNMLYEGRLGVFAPMTYLDRKDITVIRPLALMPERDVVGAANRLKLPILRQRCPADGETSRQETKEMLLALEKEKRGTMNKIFGAIRRSHLNGW
ncbi:MAG: tRNA 2-thiocytidine(32) synthetase TtcA [Clostridia bacterium]|nr:tRNA 2-thiocytidine(32) synthetase TtcA [Clostridia bacterium]